MDAYIRAVAFLSRVAGVFAALLIGLAVLVICDMVVERYFLSVPTIWQIDVVTYSIVAATFVGSAYVLMTRGHVNVEILPLHLGPRSRYWLALFTIVLSLGFCLVIFTLCTQYWYQAYSEGWLSNTVWRARLMDSLPLDAGRSRAPHSSIHCRPALSADGAGTSLWPEGRRKTRRKSRGLRPSKRWERSP